VKRTLQRALQHIQVDLDVVLGATREKWVADADDEDDFRVSVRAANKVCR